MPRGYLKHDRDAGSKISRGGASRKSNSTKDNRSSLRDWRGRPESRMHEELYEFYDEVADGTKSSTSTPEAHFIESHSIKKPTKQVGTCAICLENRSLCKLLKKCKHPRACGKCLREAYVIQAQQSVSNYPLQCFFPGCNKLVRNTQVFCLTESQAEMTRHYRLTILAKAYKNVTKKVVHCPFCDHPKSFYSEREYIVLCRNCKGQYVVTNGKSTELTTLAAVENMKPDGFGMNDGSAKCPRCEMIISKGDGCDHMICHCGHHFNWSETKARFHAKRPQVTTFVTAKSLVERPPSQGSTYAIAEKYTPWR